MVCLDHHSILFAPGSQPGGSLAARDSVSQSYLKDHWKGLELMLRMVMRDKIGCDFRGGYPRGLIMFRKGGWVSRDSDIGSGRTRKVSRVLLSGGWGARTREHENKISCLERDTTEQAEMTTTPSAPREHV